MDDAHSRISQYQNAATKRVKRVHSVAILECFAFNCTLYDGMFTAGLVLSDPVPVGLDTPPSPDIQNKLDKAGGQLAEKV